MSSRRAPAACIATLLLLLASGHARAADAHVAAKAEHGEIVLLREVPARHAYRAQPDALALIVDPSPAPELERMLGLGELSDADYAAIGAGAAPAEGDGSTTTVERMTGMALGGLGAMTRARDGTAAGGLRGIGMVGATVRGIGSQVQGALARMPVPAPPQGGGP